MVLSNLPDELISHSLIAYVLKADGTVPEGSPTFILFIFQTGNVVFEHGLWSLNSFIHPK